MAGRVRVDPASGGDSFQFSADVFAALGAGLVLSFLLPFIAYALLRSITRLNPLNAAAVAGHYGSISIVTFVAASSLLDLSDKVCRWPMGHPGEPDFHFCGEAVNPGFPYCVEHCGRAYQAQLPRGARRPPPPLPFGGPRVR